MEKTINIPTQESIDAQLREAVQQLKDYVDLHRHEISYEDFTSELNGLASCAGGTVVDNVTEYVSEPCIISQNADITAVIATKLKENRVPVNMSFSVRFLYQCNNLTMIQMPALEKVYANTSLNNMCLVFVADLPKLTSVNFDSLKLIQQASNSPSPIFANLPQLLTLSLPSLQKIILSYTGQCIYNNAALREVSMPNLEEIEVPNAYFLWTLPEIETITLPKLWKISSGGSGGGQICCFMDKVKEIHLPAWVEYNPVASAMLFKRCPKLELVEIGEGFRSGVNMSMWVPTDVLADTAATARLMQNIRTYIAGRVVDRTGTSALTITFATALQPYFDEETLTAFTSKNWNVAFMEWIK